MSEPVFSKISSPSGVSFIILQNRPLEDDWLEDESFVSGSLRFFSNLMQKLPGRAKRKSAPVKSVMQA